MIRNTVMVFVMLPPSNIHKKNKKHRNHFGTLEWWHTRSEKEPIPLGVGLQASEKHVFSPYMTVLVGVSYPKTEFSASQIIYSPGHK